MIAQMIDAIKVEKINSLLFLITTLCALGMYLIVIKQYLISRKMIKCAKNQWIPVKEKMPDYSGYYLVQLSDRIINHSQNIRLDEKVLYYEEEHRNWYYEDDCNDAIYSVSGYVTAWQMLPEPYREE